MRTATIKLLLASALFGLALPAASAQALESPWWQVLTGSRPTNLPLAPDTSETQQITSAKTNGVLAAKVEVGGVVVGCIGAGVLTAPPVPANTFCTTQTGFPASETAAQVQTMLEGPYGAGEVQVSDGPAGSSTPLLITTPGRWVPRVEITPLKFTFGGNTIQLGTASNEVISEASGRLVLTLTNLGDAPVDATGTPLTITDELPAGVSAYAVLAEAGRQGSAGQIKCVVKTISQVSCSFTGVLRSYEAIEVEVLIALTAAPAGPGTVSVSGGDGPSESVPQPINHSDAPVPFGLESFSMRAEEEGGGDTTGAGLHPFQVNATFQFNSGAQHGATRRTATVDQPALPRNVRTILPTGLVGNATAVPRCGLTEFLAKTEEFTNGCPDESAVGVATVTVIESNTFGLVRLPVPIFNLPPANGEPARFGFMAVGVPVTIDTKVDPDDEYKITSEVRNASQAAQVLSATAVLWGVPGDARHDGARGWNCVNGGATGPCVEPQNRQETPFLRMPVSCDREVAFGAELEPWNTPLGQIIASASSLSAPLGACNQEPFDPTLLLSTTTKSTESPSGLDTEVSMPNSGLLNPNDGAVSETQFKRAEVTLPEGVTVNPSAAEGLAVCTPAQYALERFDSAPGEGCPEAAKIGNIEISTPLLEEHAQGALYQAAPNDNPFDSLIALYLIARIPERGILVKQAGRVDPDPSTGQLIATFDDVPQVPFDSFKLHFREGARAPLVTPPRCGNFQTIARFVPWSALDPDNPSPDEIVERTATFTIGSGPGGGACPSGPLPFHPGFEAGSVNNNAAAYSPFLMRLTRQDGDQDITRFSAKLPPGATAKLAGVAQCPDAAIAAAKTQDGLDERANPSCPASSQIGNVLAGAGVGSVLTYAGGKLYLAGPHNGAPLSVVAIVPAVAGPFDVGTVVTRVALRIDPRTAEVEADGQASDPIPHILAGIPLKVRDIRVSVDRELFTLNPTSCAQMATQATIWSGGDNVFSGADDTAHHVSARFQAAECRSLGFSPKVSLQLKGGTRRGAFPALHLTYTPHKGRQANLKRFALRFPRSEFIEQGHFRTICTRVQFAAGQGFGSACPKDSIYGRVDVYTPLLDEPLHGKVFLRSSNNPLPDAVLALQGPPSLPIKLEVPTKIDSVNGGLRAIASNTPDAPITKVVLRMQGGQKGLFVNSRNICAQKNRATVNLTGQNGATTTLQPLMKAQGCKKSKKRK